MNEQERLAFLKTVVPFQLLPEEVLQGVVNLLEEVRYPKEAVIYQQDISKMRGVDILVEGEYNAFFYDSNQIKRLPETYGRGFCYGGFSVLLNKKKSIRTVIAKKGTVVYFLHRSHFKALCQAYEDFFQYFTLQFAKRMLNDEYAHFVKPSNSLDENYIAADRFYSRRLETVESRELVRCAHDAPVYNAAALMGKHRVSCLFVEDDEHRIIGYITDITLRDNVVARQRSSQTPVWEVMDQPIVSISPEAYVYEAMLLMFRTKTRYLLIEREGEAIGFISRNKLLSDQAQSPFVFIQSVKLAVSVEELTRKWQTVPEIVYQLLRRGVRAEIVNQMITTVADTIAQKVIEGVIDEMGPPPAKFVFMVLGSEGRKEQTLNTDQDNAIIYEDKANEQRDLVRDYFLKFAEQVSEKLNTIGFSFCEGGFMAKNPKWTHSLSHWKRNYKTWIEESNQERVMNFATFFDCRFLYGEPAIMEELKDFLEEELKELQEIFFYHMARNALQYEPPLTTFFKNIRTFTKGSQQVFNIKKTMTPIVDLVRVYALKNRIFLSNTGERLEALKDSGAFTETEYRELLQSYYYLMGMRLKNQAIQIIHDKTPSDNLMDPNKLTKVEQVTLKEIFKVISDFQAKIRLVFTRQLY
ncbi:CBS domain and cyclic nucleotide-regulated nucleotidyltransferase [Flammeovirgaceae bacterium 311]|nr:CBS domain and cyclic nucleotide-regulated nucleotidyltransferase [Flammeovirgaceae bacterium 311]